MRTMLAWGKGMLLLLSCIIILSTMYYLAACRFVLGKRMGCLNEQVPQDCQELINVVQELFESTQRLMTGPPLHIMWSTKEWKFQKQTTKRLHELSLKHVKEKLEEIREEDHGRALEGSEPPEKVDILTYLIHSGKQSLEEAATNAVDLMTGGIDTVCCSVNVLAEFLSNHPPDVNMCTGFKSVSCRHPTP